MDRFDAMQAFARVVEAGSFTKAAVPAGHDFNEPAMVCAFRAGKLPISGKALPSIRRASAFQPASSVRSQQLTPKRWA